MFYIAVLGIILNFKSIYASAITDTINNLDASGNKSGWWVIKNDNQQNEECDANAILEQGRFKEGKKNGVWKSYYCNGSLKSEITYADDKKLGWAKIYWANGKIMEEGFWRINHWEGKYKMYYETGALYYDFNFDENGKRDGNQKYYHPNGKIMYEGTWKDSKENGIVKEYDASGNLLAENFYNDGLFSESQSKTYQPKTQIQETINEEKIPPPPPLPEPERIGELKDGFNKTYTKEGKILQEGEFKNQKLINGKKYIYEDGVHVKTQLIVNGAVEKVINEKSKK